MGADERIRKNQLNQLFEAVLLLDDVEECYRFFEDLCTVAELRSLAQRWVVAQMLARGESYNNIARETGASTATISRVKRFLDYGADGYKMVIDRKGRGGNLIPGGGN